MKFSLIQKKQKRVEIFHDKQWREQNFEYFGKDFKWKYLPYTLVSREGEEILGVVKFIINCDVVFVDSLIVAKSTRGKGIGKALLKKVEEIAKKEGCHKVHLYTGKGWPAEEFYQNLDYIKTADLPKHFLKKDFVEYTKFLS